MITLATQDQTTLTTVFNGVTTTTLTDTLFVSYIEINFESGTVSAFIQKGTIVNGDFVCNLPKIRVNVNPDGTFSSSDGQWTGTIPNWSPTLAALASPLDGLVTGAGLVSGTVVANPALPTPQKV